MNEQERRASHALQRAIAAAKADPHGGKAMIDLEVAVALARLIEARHAGTEAEGHV